MTTELTPMPELQQAILDVPTLRALFRDLEQLSQIVEIKAKYKAQDYAQSHQLTLAETLHLLLNNQVHAIQIRYLFDGKLWWDTLVQSSEGVRLTRVDLSEV